MTSTAITSRRRFLTTSFATVALLTVSPSALAQDVITQGTKWTKKSQKITGSWSIVKEGEKHFVVLEKNFKTRSAPDLKLFLTTDTAKQLNNRNAIKNGTLIAKLKSAKGAQRYQLPPQAVAALADAKSLIIHCEQYTKLWGVAEFKQ